MKFTLVGALLNSFVGPYRRGRERVIGVFLFCECICIEYHELQYTPKQTSSVYYTRLRSESTLGCRWPSRRNRIEHQNLFFQLKWCCNSTGNGKLSLLPPSSHVETYGVCYTLESNILSQCPCLDALSFQLSHVSCRSFDPAETELLSNISQTACARFTVVRRALKISNRTVYPLKRVLLQCDRNTRYTATLGGFTVNNFLIVSRLLPPLRLSLILNEQQRPQETVERITVVIHVKQRLCRRLEM